MKKKKRPYRMEARGRAVAETRARIVEATMALHQEVGPRKTTISAIARRAEVERLTVYRHFPDENAVFAACSHRFIELNPPPDAVAWSSTADPVDRLERGLRELYDYYARTREMFDKVYRDADGFDSLKAIMDGFDEYLRGLAEALAAGWGRGGRRVSRVLRHAVRFSTWVSLDDDRADNRAKVKLIAAWVKAVARG